MWICVGSLLLATYSRRDLFFSINGHYSTVGDTLMYYLTWLGQAEVIIPTLILLPIIPRFRSWRYLLTAILCNAIPFVIHHYIKGYLNHPRPRLMYKDTLSQIHFQPHWEELLHNGFPSGHSQGAFSFFCFLSLLLPEKYRSYGLLFFLLALTVAYSRLYLAAHFFDDVYAGSIFGAMSTTLIFSVMEHIKGGLFKKK